MDEARAFLPANLCEQLGRVCIHPHRLGLVAFAIVDIRQGGRIHERIEIECA